MKILLNEIFYSFQGEGPSMGRASVFVRLGGCNLQCTWCDSKFTWDPKLQDNQQVELEDVVSEIAQYDCDHLVITGGEPLMQQKAIAAILEALPGYTAEVETNGSVAVEIDESRLNFNCSPKLSNSGNEAYELKVKPAKNVSYKFVVCEPGDMAEINEYIADNGIDASSVYLMGEGVSREVQLTKADWLLELCREFGYHYSPRLHVLAFNDERKK